MEKKYLVGELITDSRSLFKRLSKYKREKFKEFLEKYKQIVVTDNVLK